MKYLTLSFLPILLLSCSERKQQPTSDTAGKGNVPLPLGVTVQVQDLPDSISFEEANKFLPEGDTEWVDYKGQKLMMIRTSSCSRPKSAK